MGWRKPTEEEHELLIRFLKRAAFETFLGGLITVLFFVAMIVCAVLMIVTGKISVVRAIVMIVIGVIGAVIMFLAYRSDGKLKRAEAKTYNVIGCYVTGRVISTGYKKSTYYVNVIGDNGKKYRVKVPGTIARHAKEGRKGFIVRYNPNNDEDKMPWDLIIRKDLDNDEL